MKRIVLTIAMLAGMTAGTAQAAGLAGIWLTPPDQKAQTGHVQIVPCGQTYCGTVIGAFDRNGQPIVTRAVGRRVLWDVTPAGPRHQGRVFVPTMNATFPVTLVENGNRLSLRACNSVGICRSQTWQRVR